MQKEGAGRVALITGASSGFGRATAVRMAQRGFRVFATVRGEAKASDLRAAAREAGVDVEVAFLELTDDLTRAEEHFHRALDLTREIGDRKLRSLALNNLGRVAIDKGEWNHALTRFKRLEELAEELGWPLLRYLSLRNQASCEVSLGHIEAALRSLRTCTEKGDEVLIPSERFFVRVILFEAYLRILDDTRAQAARLTRAFAPLAPRVAHLRQRGMILAFDVPNAPPRFAETFHLKARAHELLIRPIGSTVYLMPPYLIDDATAAFLAEAVTATLNDVLA